MDSFKADLGIIDRTLDIIQDVKGSTRTGVRICATFHSVGCAASRPATASKVRVDDVDLAYAYSRMVGLQGCLEKTM